jgi:hypothetical protein
VHRADDRVPPARGARGGKATSAAKAEAARATGLLGGRPRKHDRELV